MRVYSLLEHRQAGRPTPSKMVTCKAGRDMLTVAKAAAGEESGGGAAYAVVEDVELGSLAARRWPRPPRDLLR